MFYATLDGKKTLYKVAMTRSPTYKLGVYENPDDVALGIVTEVQKDGKWTTLEAAGLKTVDGVQQRRVLFGFAENDAVTLWGYGCTKKDGTGGNDGVLRTGSNSIFMIKPTFSRLSKEGAWLCMGDSGGPVMKDGAVIAVNSKAIPPMVLDETKIPPVKELPGIMYVAQLHSEGVKKFFADFALKNSSEICGLNSDCGR
jgi:hypothetical protein